MKKLTSLFLVLTILACISCAAAEQEPVVENLPAMGLSFTYPPEMLSAKGTISTEGVQILDQGILYAYWYYAAATPEEFNRMITAEPEKIQNLVTVLFYAFAVSGGRDFTAVADATQNQVTAENAVLIGEAGNWHFYLYTENNDGFADAVDQEFGEEFTALCGMRDRYAAAFSCSVPFGTDTADGAEKPVFRFDMTDLEGNPVSSEDFFAQHEITMINIWATWCGPCVSELGELQKIHTRIQEQDCAILGLLIDSDIDVAKKLIADNGMTYPVLLAPERFSSYYPFTVVPTTIFVNRRGELVGGPIEGVQTEQYEETIRSLLGQ